MSTVLGLVTGRRSRMGMGMGDEDEDEGWKS
jgi:hypothetical protein